jgi:hypothetical protein
MSLIPFRIAFDCQGVLIVDGPTPENIKTRYRGQFMPDMVKVLVAGGAEVHCISAAPEGNYESWQVLATILRGIPLHGIHPAWVPPGSTAYEVGKIKAEVMRQFNIPILVDDNSEVCRGVRESGLIAVNYSVGWEPVTI